MELEIRHLRIICAIAEAGSLGRGAAALRLTQPGLSTQLRRIEALLGGELFERRPSGAVPTAFGEAVLARARSILPTVDDLLGNSALAARVAGPVPHLRLGSVNVPLLGGLIATLKEHHPAARIVSRGQGSAVPLLDDVANGRLDLAVVGDSPGYELAPRPGVALEPIAVEPLFLLLSADHPLAAHGEIALADLAEEDWASPRPDDDRIREYWSTTLLGAGHRMRTVHEVEGRLLLDLVRGGHAVSLCQATFEELPGVAVRPIADAPLRYRHLLAWHRSGPLDHLGPTLVRRARDAHRAAAARSPAYLGWQRRNGAEPPAR